MVVMRVGDGGGLGEGGGGGVLAGRMGWGARIGDPGADGCGVGLVFEGPGVGCRGTGVGRRDEGLVRGADVGIGGSGTRLGFSSVPESHALLRTRWTRSSTTPSLPVV